MENFFLVYEESKTHADHVGIIREDYYHRMSEQIEGIAKENNMFITESLVENVNDEQVMDVIKKYVKSRKDIADDRSVFIEAFSEAIKISSRCFNGIESLIVEEIKKETQTNESK